MTNLILSSDPIGGIFVVVIGGVVAYLIYLGIDSLKKYTENYIGTIIDKHFNGATHSTGIGIAMVGTTVTPIITSSSTDDVWEIIVKDNTGGITKIEVSNKLYFDCKVNDEVGFRVYRNWLSKGISDINVTTHTKK